MKLYNTVDKLLGPNSDLCKVDMLNVRLKNINVRWMQGWNVSLIMQDQAH